MERRLSNGAASFMQCSRGTRTKSSRLHLRGGLLRTVLCRLVISCLSDGLATAFPSCCCCDMLRPPTLFSWCVCCQSTAKHRVSCLALLCERTVVQVLNSGPEAQKLPLGHMERRSEILPSRGHGWPGAGAPFLALRMHAELHTLQH